jgi:hypothetical protein
MKTSLVKTSLLIAMALAGIAASSPSFAKVRSHEYRYNGGHEVLVNRPSRPSGNDTICQSPSDYRCPSANGG